ncbi:MAG TPA: hypothetical protein VM324_10750, partial [Egibacteraceae bacterium]|nr:hypothetical protein [Egibacteraceae bacterium]
PPAGATPPAAAAFPTAPAPRRPRAAAPGVDLTAAPAAAPTPVTGAPGRAHEVPASAVRPQPSALAERVADIVERLELAPAPRRVTVDAGELRLVVSLRGDAVRIAVLGTGAAAPAGWERDLSAALSARGFSLAGDGAHERPAPEHRPPPESTVPAPGSRQRRPPSRPAPAGWRL